MIRVLHIDDEAPIRLLVRVNLEAEGLEVIEAADGRTAIPLAKREQPDVILLNVNLPGPDGWQVAEKLRENRETRETPIVFLTARAAFRDRAHGLDVGAVDYITKPFNPLELAPRLLATSRRSNRPRRPLTCNSFGPLTTRQRTFAPMRPTASSGASTTRHAASSAISRRTSAALSASGSARSSLPSPQTCSPMGARRRQAERRPPRRRPVRHDRALRRCESLDRGPRA